MRRVRLVPITQAAFAPYGELLPAPATAPRRDGAAAIVNGRGGAAANLALVRGEPFAGLMPLRRLERHAHSSQTFLPLAVDAYVVVLAPDRDGLPDEGAIVAYRVPGTTGLNYRPGAWHAHMMTLAAPGTFAMLVHEDGTDADCTFAAIAPVLVEGAAE